MAGSVSAPYREVTRARVLLDAADGVANSAIAQRHGVTAVTVRAWRNEFVANGLTEWGKVKTGRGRKYRHGPEQDCMMRARPAQLDHGHLTPG